jgi:hypothetical protein
MFFLSGGEVLQVLRHCLAGEEKKKKGKLFCVHLDNAI